MSTLCLPLLVGTIGPAGFALLAWGAILIVVAAFGYIICTLLADRQGG